MTLVRDVISMNRKSKVFFVHLYNDFSGSPKVLADAIDVVKEHYSATYLFTSGHNGFLSNADCCHVLIPYLRFNNRFLILISYIINQVILFFVLGFYFFLARVKGESVEVIVNTIMPFSATLCARVFLYPVTTYLHEVSLNSKALFGFLKFISINFSSRIICVSNYMIEALNLSTKKNVFVVQNSVGKNWDSYNYTYDIDLKFHYKQVLFVGSLKSFKGIEEFIGLASENPSLNFVAALNCEPEEFDSFFMKDIPDNVRLYYRPDKLKELYQKSMFVLNLSHVDTCVETFGLTLIEGFSFGCVAIAPPVGGPVELVTHDVGLLANSKDLSTISDFINSLVCCELTYKRYSLSALSISSKYTYSAYSQAILQSLGLK